MKEEFKKFVSVHPELIKHVNSDKMTWQKFYDMYSLYGKDSEVWDDYFNKKEETNGKIINDIVNIIKKADVDTIQKNISTVNKALSLVSSLLTKEEDKNEYTPRPLYKKFED